MGQAKRRKERMDTVMRTVVSLSYRPVRTAYVLSHFADETDQAEEADLVADAIRCPNVGSQMGWGRADRPSAPDPFPRLSPPPPGCVLLVDLDGRHERVVTEKEFGAAGWIRCPDFPQVAVAPAGDACEIGYSGDKGLHEVETGGATSFAALAGHAAYRADGFPTLPTDLPVSLRLAAGARVNPEDPVPYTHAMLCYKERIAGGNMIDGWVDLWVARWIVDSMDLLGDGEGPATAEILAESVDRLAGMKRDRPGAVLGPTLSVPPWKFQAAGEPGTGIAFAAAAASVARMANASGMYLPGPSVDAEVVIAQFGRPENPDEDFVAEGVAFETVARDGDDVLRRCAITGLWLGTFRIAGMAYDVCWREGESYRPVDPLGTEAFLHGSDIRRPMPGVPGYRMETLDVLNVVPMPPALVTYFVMALSAAGADGCRLGDVAASIVATSRRKHVWDYGEEPFHARAVRGVPNAILCTAFDAVPDEEWLEVDIEGDLRKLVEAHAEGRPVEDLIATALGALIESMPGAREARAASRGP